MADSIKTYWAKRVNIKALRGHKFQFDLNLKNEDGSNYDIPDGHVAFFGVFQKPENTFFSEPIYSSENSSNNLYYKFPTEINNNTISVNLDSNASGSSFEHQNLYAAPGYYEYVLFTYDPENVPDITFPSEDEMPNNQYLNVEYIHPEAETVYTYLPFYQTQINGIGYYHEWFMMGGDGTITPYCLSDIDAVPLLANVSEGETQINPISLYNQSYYSDSADIWNGDSFVFSEGMNSLIVRVGVQYKNICRCLFPTSDAVINTNNYRSNYVSSAQGSAAHEITTKESVEFNTGHVPAQAANGVFYFFNDGLSPHSELNTIEWPNGTPWHLTSTHVANFMVVLPNIQAANLGSNPSLSDASPDYGVDGYLTNPFGWGLASEDIAKSHFYLPNPTMYKDKAEQGWGFTFGFWPVGQLWSYIDEQYYTAPEDESEEDNSWHTYGSIFFGFVDFVDEDSAQSFMSQNPQQWINTLPGVEAQQFNENDENTFFSSLEYQRAESKFKVRLKASIVNAGHKDVWLQQTSASILNAINTGENFISIRYGMRLLSDNSVEISLTKQVHIEPIFYSESGAENFIFNQNTQFVYDIYNSLDNVPQNLDVILDFNSIAADMQAQYPGEEVEMFYEHVDLITTNPFALVLEDQSYSVWEDVYEDVEKEFYWDGTEEFFDVVIDKGDFNVYVGADFKGSYFEDAEHWNGEFITFETGMSKVEFSLKTKTWSYLNAVKKDLISNSNSDNIYYWPPHGLSKLVEMGTVKYSKLGIDLRNETQGTTINVPVTIDSWNTEAYQNAAENTVAYAIFPYSTSGFGAMQWKQWHSVFNIAGINAEIPEAGIANYELDYHFLIPEGFAETGDHLYIHIYSENEGNHSTIISGNNDPKGLLSCRMIGGEGSWAEMLSLSTVPGLGGASLFDLGADEAYIQDEFSPVNPFINSQTTPGVFTYLLAQQGLINNNIQQPTTQIEAGLFVSEYGLVDIVPNPQFTGQIVPVPGAHSYNRIRFQGKRIKCEWTTTQFMGQEEVNVEMTGYNAYTEDVSHILNTQVSIEELAPINVTKEAGQVLAQEGIPFSAINDFKFTYQVKEKDGDIIFNEFERTITLAQPDNTDTSIWEEFGYKEMNTSVPIENFGIPPGTEIEIIIKPESFRKFNNELDGWIRLTKTNIVCTWRNNLYISNTELFKTPTKSHYWLYGDFIIDN